MKNRGFECIKGFTNLFSLPKRQTIASAGYDFYLNKDYIVKSGEILKINTGVKAYMRENEVLEIYIRSSLGIAGLMMKNSIGIIDSDYYSNPKNDGEIILCVENTSSNTMTFTRGDRIAQGIFKNYLVVDNDNSGEKRNGGFGSTTK